MATVKAAFDDNFNCYKCMKRYGADPEQDRGRGVAKRKSKGCFDFTTRSFLIDNIQYKSCIGNYTLQGLGYYFELAVNYDKGMTPTGQDIGDCPNKLIEVIHAIDSIKKEEQKKAAK